MTRLKEITVIDDGNDWIGLYVDGELALQGRGRRHHADILAFGSLHAPYRVKLLFADTEWAASKGRLPKRLADVKVASEGNPQANLAA